MAKQILSSQTKRLMLEGKIPCQACWSLVQHGSGKKSLSPEERAQIAAEYVVAYAEANPGKHAMVVCTGRGWYEIWTNGKKSFGRKHRIRSVAEMALRLVERVHGKRKAA